MRLHGAWRTETLPFKIECLQELSQLKAEVVQMEREPLGCFKVLCIAYVAMLLRTLDSHFSKETRGCRQLGKAK